MLPIIEQVLSLASNGEHSGFEVLAQLDVDLTMQQIEE